MTNDSTSDVENLKDIVYNYVEERQGVSFVELERLLDDWIDVEGDMWIASTVDPNIYYWIDMSDEFADVILELLDAERLYFHVSAPVVYLVDGKMPDIEIARDPPEDGYKTERWLPVVFCTYEQTFVSETENV